MASISTHKRTIPLSSTATQPSSRKEGDERCLMEVTSLPTAAGRESRVIDWVRGWAAKRDNLRIEVDASGNVLLSRQGKPRRRGGPAPLVITAHLDHPAFVVRSIIDSTGVELEFRGGVHDPYFTNAAIEIFDAADRAHRARIQSLDAGAKPFKRITARLELPADSIQPGDVGRWRFEHEKKPVPRIEDGLLHTHACDDLAAVAAALCVLDVLREVKGCEHVGLLLTRAEEVGFIGAIAACKNKTVARNARLICLENSRSFPHDSPVGAGPIVRVGDKLSVFEPTLTNQISMLMMEHQKAAPHFRYQRKLMPGGTCEATTFSTFGYQSTCLCLPLGNYHNMIDIDGVTSGASRSPHAHVGPEFISLSDYHGLIEMLIVCATQMDAAGAPTLKGRMNDSFKDFGFVLDT